MMRQLLQRSSLAAGLALCFVWSLSATAEENREETDQTVETAQEATKEAESVAEAPETKRPRQEVQLLPDLTNAALLHFAASTGDVETIRREVEAGADIDLPLHPPGDGWVNATPLLVASAYGQLEAVCVLVELGADVQASTRVGGTAFVGGGVVRSC